MAESKMRRVRVMINPKSGVFWSFGAMQEVMERVWGSASDLDLSYQFSHSAEDGVAKARRCVDEAFDAVVVVGGDGMVNSIGGALMGTDVALGVIPAGSGNGFARHFNIPLNPEKAAHALMDGNRMKIDVGVCNDRPFFVTCSLAWDAAIVRSFEKYPVRGILPYVFAAVTELIDYSPQPFDVLLDESEPLHFDDPVIFTIANLTQFGSGARIAPHACPDDGYLELVVALQKDIGRLLPRISKLFDGTVNQVSEVQTRRFQNLRVTRERAAPVQVDGELMDPVNEVSIRVWPGALNILIPGDL